MKKIILILILTFFCFVNSVFSQTKTPYQKKVDQIMTETFEAIGVKSSLIQIAKKSNNWDIVKNSQDFALKCKLLEKEELLVIVTATDKRLKDAEKLKNDEDFKRDRERQQKISLQQELKLRERLTKYSDFSKMKSDIKSSFSKWIDKDEFETSKDYQNRISNKENVLDSIVFELIVKRIDLLIPNKCTNQDDSPYYLELIKYNADKQIYHINLISRAYTGIPQYGTYQKMTDKINDTLYVNVEVAKLLKENSTKDRYKTKSDADIIWFCNKGVTTSKNLKEWMITPNGYFIPKTYNLFNQYKHTNKQNLTQLNKMKIKISELGLEEFFSNDYIIDIEKAWAKSQSK